MRPRLFWLTAALLFGVVLHASYLLLAPGFALGRSVAASGVSIDTPVFRVLSAADQTTLFPTFPRSSVFGLCAFDIGTQSAKIEAVMPEMFWTLTIYSRSGRAIYALNSGQAGTSNFAVSLRLAPTLIEQLTGASEDVSSQDGWNVSAPEPKGFAVLWVPVREEAERAAVEKTLAQTRCAAVPSV